MLGCRGSDGSGAIALPIDESSRFSAPTAFGPYRVLHQAGSGVLGPVFRAFDLPHDHLVAIKVFTVTSGIDQVTALATALRRLAGTPAPHPAVVLPVEAGVEGTTPYVVLPHQNGETLDLLIRRSAPATPESILPIVRSIATAIDAAHVAGLDHGGLHARDIFVSADGGVSVLGFGVLRALAAAGLPVPVRRQCSAPERQCGIWDGRADLYALGVILHEWLTSRRPLVPGEQDGEFALDLPPERRVHLRTMLARALASDPAARFDTAADLVAALEVASGAVLTPASENADVMDDAAAWRRAADSAAAVAGGEDVVPLGAPAAHASIDVFRAPHVRSDSVVAAGRRSRVSGVLALVALGVCGALGGHLAVRAWRSADTVRVTDGTADAGVPDDPVETTDVAIDAPPASAVEDRDLHAPVAPDVATAAVTATGRLLVRSEPAGAMVTVDGRRLGQTPAVINALPLGVHVVQVARSGYVPRVAHVTLAPDAPEGRVSFALQPGLDAATARVGRIDIGSRPRGARVWLEGRFVGHTPLRVPQLKPGRYTVTLELAGYQPYTGSVGVSAGALSTLAPTLSAFNR